MFSVAQSQGHDMVIDCKTFCSRHFGSNTLLMTHDNMSHLDIIIAGMVPDFLKPDQTSGYEAPSSRK
jgi:hypothetical protein